MKRREEFSVAEATSVTVQNRSGSIDVRVGASDRVIVALDGADAGDWDVTQLGGAVSVEPGRGLVRRVRSMRVLIEVPAGSDIDVKSASASVALSGSFGSARVKSASGDVRVGSVARLEVDTASGDMNAAVVEAAASCRTASGDVDLGRIGGRLTVSTASGDVRVGSSAADVEIGSASGDVGIERFDGAAINVKSISGSVSVGLPAGIRVDPDLVTLSGRTRLPEPARPGGPIDRRTVRVGLRTVSGDITIHRVDAR